MKIWYKYLKPHLKYFILGPICIIVEVIGEILMPKYLAMIINNSATSGIDYSIKITLLMVLTALLMMAGGVGGAYFGTKASVYFGSDLRADVYQKVQKFSFTNIDKFSTGSLITRLTNDIRQIQNFINTLLRICLRAPGMMIGSLIMAILIQPKLSVVFLVSIPMVVIFVIFIILIGLPRFTRLQNKIDNLNNRIQENIINARVVKSFVRENFEINKFYETNNDLKQAGLSAMGVMILLSPVMTLILNFTIIAVIWFGGGLVIAESNAMPIGDLSAFIAYCNQILMSLMMITMIIVMSSRSIASSKRIKEVLMENIDIIDDDITKHDLIITKGEIEFKNVSFSYYKNSAKKVLDNINLKIPADTTVGIIGATGSGKTTLVSLITRLYAIDEGEILIDGVNINNYSLASLREKVGMVLQQNQLFSGTIIDNLKWGNKDASEAEIRHAAIISQADKFIRDFPNGYQTIINKGGVNVSGGQKQRLCIARALLKNPKILIFDDSTSAVDTATEALIKAAYQAELKNATKIIIAQRISSVKDADMIYVLNDGRIVGSGNHEKLLQNCKEYQEIYNSQIQKKEVK